MRGRIDAFNHAASTYLQGLHRIEQLAEEVLPLDDEATDEEEEEDPFAPTDSEMTGEPETTSLLLPSSLGYDACIKLKLKAVMEKEIKLREGQANDALDGLRQSIGEKSFMFRERLRFAKGIQQTTRARSRIMAVDRTLTHHRCVYGFARRALIELGAEVEGETSTYKPVTRSDLKASALVYNINEPGQHNAKLAWFWAMNGETTEAAEGALMDECGSLDSAPKQLYSWDEQSTEFIGWQLWKSLKGGRKNLTSRQRRWNGPPAFFWARLSIGPISAPASCLKDMMLLPVSFVMRSASAACGATLPPMHKSGTRK